jgi:HAMP domain-containing protein
MNQDQTLILWIIVTVTAAFAAGCSLGATFRTKHPRKATANARRK